MGMYDTVYCDRTLPDGKKVTNGMFQTKHLGCGLTEYRITTEGKLLRVNTRYESTDAGLRPVASTQEEVPAHMDLLLHGTTDSGEFVEYIARFTEGRLVSFRPRSELPEVGDWLVTLLP